MRPLVKVAAASFLAFAGLASLGSAQARIVCEDQFQIVDGNAISTPYCADRYLAHVARTYGMKVTAKDVRNPSTKRRVCEFMGYDNRVYSICSGWRNNGGNVPRN